MNKSLYPENRIKVAESIRKNLKEALGENFLQANISTDNGELILTYKSKNFTVRVSIEH
jgi:hypothetical protein